MQKSLRKISFASLILAVISLSACDLIESREQSERIVEKAIMDEPNTREFWAAIKENYPNEFDVLIKRIIDAGEISPEESSALSLKWMIELEAKHGPSMKYASAESISALLASTITLARTLETRDLSSCAKLATGKSVQPSTTSPHIQDAVQRNKADKIRAMASGRDNPATRVEPGEQDFIALSEKMRALGTSERLTQILSDENQLISASEADQCTIGIALYEAVKALPSEQSTRLGIYFLMPPT